MSSSNNPRFTLGALASSGVPDRVDPASANTCWEWVGSISKLGWSVVAVEMKYSKPHLEKVGPGFEEWIGEELGQAGLGEFDSLEAGDPFKLFFYFGVGCLPAGLPLLRGALEKLGLLALSKIFVADTAEKAYRLWYPGFGSGAEVAA